MSEMTTTASTGVLVWCVTRGRYCQYASVFSNTCTLTVTPCWWDESYDESKNREAHNG